ncbi:MAG: type II secretion system protein [Pseudobdellovibrionaceae bacterium]
MKKIKSAQLRPSRGFTLIEVMLAAVIMATGLILLTNSWGGSYARLKKTKLNHELVSLMERQMTIVEMKYRNDFANIPEEDGEAFEDAPGYSWKLTSKPFEMPDIASTLTAREGGADEMLMTMIKTLTEHLGKAVKEVTLTVMADVKKQKPLEFSITTYFVDYAKPIPLPGMGAGGGAGGDEGRDSSGASKSTGVGGTN